jgi:cytochrome c5
MSTLTILRRESRALTVAAFLAMLMLLAGGCSEQQSSAPEEAVTMEAPAEPTMEPEAMPAEMAEPAAEMEAPAAEEAAPAAEEAAPAAEAEAPVAASGEDIYKKACQACHAAGIAGAPKLGDKEAWAPRIAKGNDAMLESVKNGLNAMPPKGACMSCSDDDLRSAMEYMVSQGS